MRKIVFLTGTRADFGKIKSLLQILQDNPDHEAHIFATGMHMIEKYGNTVIEIEKCGFKNIYQFINSTSEASMDLTLAKTVEGFSSYVKRVKPDLIVVHGDRVEALAGALVGSLNNILVAHIEGGEISGTIDELIRHSTSKMSHIHYVSNDLAKKRLIQMGELEESIFIIGSPDIDIMFSDTLPTIDIAKEYYDIVFKDYAIAMFHPVTTEYENMSLNANNFVDALLDDTNNYVVIYPNNDLGSELIFNAYERLRDNPRFRIFPSARFEYFLSLLKHSKFMIGNSSAGIRETPYYGVPAVNIGTRQQNRASHESVINTDYSVEGIKDGIARAIDAKPAIEEIDFGTGNSAKMFLETLNNEEIWQLSNQKQFLDL
ncbi:MAG: UDP-N-acetylglucosamine 2-epimerase (hydrolyzing) [Bacteroidia bacterium]|nr:UDP-N-acetylglucosamine 2-epimerase (hydrolyzing) [Bacteroidia bacterium]